MSDPIIKLTHSAFIKLTAWSIVTQGREYSGTGIIDRQGNVITVLDVDLLGVGSPTYTEFSFDKPSPFKGMPNRKLWYHRHPVGNGVPGQHNWSGRDRQTAEVEPFGVPAQLVQWSCSIVLTPKGWVGRVDFYLPELRTYHCAVEPNLPTEQDVIEATALIDNRMRQEVDDLLHEFHALQRANRPFTNQPAMSGYEESDFDFTEPIVDAGELYCPTCHFNALEPLGSEDVGGVMEVAFLECLNCGEICVIPDYHSCALIDLEAHKPKSEPAWKLSRWWRSIRR